jgi:chromosome segregation ATPase
MSDVMTANEARQIVDLLQSMDKKLDVHIARTEEQFKTLRAEFKAEIAELRSEVKALDDKVDLKFEAVQLQVKAVDAKVDALRSELRDDISDLKIQQRSTDARLWAFVVGLVTLVGGGVIKVLWFDRG